MNIIEWLRQFRIGEFAIFDFAVSYIGIYLISPLLTKIFHKIHISIPKKSWIYLTLPIGIIAHQVTGTITPMNRNFFDLEGHYILKVIILGMVVLGLRGIEKVK